ncbi:MAG: hypothetical protein COV36_02780 [Alphaproteobacteria bacterium CG11_big_fil_rev_8_21_14_0_20_44_7]|nr:MAG: hypothetical protein COV36_02780 [Alphaproteobacteria bacterium CG11_big_fil_rev_8_21_14_0_20_44_7]
MRKIILAFLVTTSLTPASSAEIDPNIAVLEALQRARSGVSVENSKYLNRLPSEEIEQAELNLIPLVEEINAEPAAGESSNPSFSQEIQKAKEAARHERQENKASKSAHKATTWFSSRQDGQRLTFTFNSRPQMTQKNEGEKLVFVFSSPVDYEAPEIPDKFKESFLNIKEDSDKYGNLILTVTKKAGVEVNVSQNSRRLYLDSKIDVAALKAKEEAEKKKAEAAKNPKEAEVAEVEKVVEPPKMEAVKPAEKPISQPTAADYIDFSKADGVEKFTLNFEEDISVAVFERQGFYWIVADTKKDVTTPPVSESDIFSDIEKVENESGSLIYKLPLKKRTNASVKKTDNSWEIEFAQKSEYKLAKSLINSELRDYNSIKLAEPSEVITIKDDFLGENILVVPLKEAAVGVGKREVYKDIILEKTVQGAVINPIVGLPEAKIVNDELRVYRVQEEQKIAAIEEDAEIEVKQPIFAFAKWGAIDAEEFKKLQSKFIREDNYKLGRLLFMQKLYIESALTLKDMPGFDAGFLTGAGYFMAGRYEEALESFNKLSVAPEEDYNELELWRLASDFMLTRTAPQNLQFLEFPSDFKLPANLENYPTDIAASLMSAITEKRIVEGEIAEAQNYINEYPDYISDAEESYKMYLQAAIYEKEGKRARARELWQKVIKRDSDRLSRARSHFAVISQDLKLARISTEEAAQLLDKLRVVWRGDNFEYQLLKDFAGLEVENKNYITALRAYKEAISAYPDHPENPELSNAMKDTYKMALGKEFSSQDKTFEALSLYYEFEELKPTGEEGDMITLELAEKLVEVDLLHEATKVLRKYSQKTKDPEEKALIMTRIAILSYMNNDADSALKVLADSMSDNIPKYLKDEREILAVESLIKLGRTTEAMQVLVDLQPAVANRYRAEIFWQEKKWQEMISTYKLVKDKTEEDVIKLAIAYELTDNVAALKTLELEYSELMKESAFADSFRFITDTEDLDYKNLAATLNIDFTKIILGKYKDRLKATSLGTLAEEKNDV